MDERDRFEAAYAAMYREQMGGKMTAEEISKLRDGDAYGAHRIYLNGCWDGWKLAREASEAQ
jgi:hypothetical protein